ncbi:thiol-disulfide oxidoreductase DCC family protein [Phnomibacter ginsenosidimutans]|uniref:thiol-disulfide oxidoreductase DCC family protein n=1 Tax=Phnomibacter ginsenosidimutans TaxID=2676868 RepID=UPI001FEC1E35|nr:DUF393 domain-containing protein [Phnomibacter ginsenosidimutans]
MVYATSAASSVQQVLTHDAAGYFQFASLQGAAGQQLLQQHGLPLTDFNSFVLIEDGVVYTRSTAALRAARHLRGYKWLYPLIVVPRFLRDAVQSGGPQPLSLVWPQK